MGSEDLFHKRKARKGTELDRQKKDRATRLRYLIVCEGAKTEPHYFQELINDLHIQTSTVRIAPNKGSSPDKVVSHALALYDEDARAGDPFDKVFCVFDRDTHTTFDAACKTIAEQKKPATTFHAITSTPCFEFWLLLHFGYTDKPFQKTGNKSIGDKVVDALKTKKGFEAYDKGQRGIYATLKDQLPTAVKAAQRLRQLAQETGQTNPATNVDELVLALQALANPG